MTKGGFGSGTIGSIAFVTIWTYVHVNPLKHGYVPRVIDWPYSTFHRYVAEDIYLAHWCGAINAADKGGD